jgi:hypothetical protein
MAITTPQALVSRGERFRQMAGTLTDKINHLRGTRKENTPKRAR